VPNPRIEDVTQEAICAMALGMDMEPLLLERLTAMQARLPFGLRIISSGRTREEQAALKAEGRPTAEFRFSTHALEDEQGCPRLSTGADLSPDVAAVVSVKHLFGAEAVFAGLRWGGGSPLDQDGIPSDWNHLDLGPRTP